VIASQLGNGWQPSNRVYEDSGVSGSHLQRPGLQALLVDASAGRIDVVVVHRLDRLTRHLGDLQKLMELFEHHGVALVSVTQSLDTTDLHGRLALNLLTSFAQFERELIGERSREKRAATRRQGVWYGNAPPLGYYLVRQHLVVDPNEAEVVRQIWPIAASRPSAGKPKLGRPVDVAHLIATPSTRCSTTAFTSASCFTTTPGIPAITKPSCRPSCGPRLMP